ncbi:MAG: ornithine cyclodeaminase family protein [Gemmatimonadales bacterium]|nr:ornithine cyclodeaminase family protein [Gemmatimonadales bacterium]
MPVRILTQEQVTDLLPMPACVDLMDAALRAMTRGGAILPLRTMLRLPEGRGIFGSMPSYLNPPDAIGLKAITVFPGNEGTKYDSHQGVVLLFEAVHGSLVAILDASSITAIRTAAVSGVATRALARADAGDLAILGAGVQAMTHLDAMAAVRPLRRVRVWSRTPASVEKFVAAAKGRHPVVVEPAPTVEAALRGADLVCTVTSSRAPVLERRMLADGCHLNVVGASLATARELDSDTVAAARVYTDRRESLLAESGDFLIPRSEGRYGDEHLIGEVGEVLEGKVEGRRNASDLTLFKSLGLAIEDLAAAHYVNQRAAERGIGVVLEIGGLRHD